MFFATVDDVSSAVIDLGTYETRAGKSSKSSHSAFNIRIQLNLRVQAIAEKIARGV